ncbi:MAG: sigma-54 dependent transcriptional regulator [Flavobacteriales bacterium]
MALIPGTIVIVDDDADVLLSARMYLEQYFERVVALNKPADLMPQLQTKGADVVLLDMNYHRGRNNGREGIQLLKQIKNQVACEVVMMTAYGEVELAVEAVKSGAMDFIIKPWSNEKLLTTMMSAMELRKNRQELHQLKRQQQAWTDASDKKPLLIGESAAIHKIRDLIEQVAPTDANVLILGENGTGKEVVAQLIHHRSTRMSGPFVKVDLGAVHENLFESELFGAKKGAYTDLKQNKAGRFELANSGTLFLDEVGNLSPANQAKLLSVLQNRSIIPVGSNHATSINVRLISATNADLHEMISNKEFRQDLLYRINTIEINIPPLRERSEDIAPLAEHFIRSYARKYQKPELKLSASDLKMLRKYSWPGNIRELQHAIERAVIMSSGDLLIADQISPKRKTNLAEEFPIKLDELERQHIENVIERNRGNISQAAKDLGLTRAALYRRIEKHGL